MFALIAFALSAPSNTTEVHPKFTWSKCTKAGCTKVNGFIVHDKHIGDTKDRGTTGIDYEKDVGVTVKGDTVIQKLVSNGAFKKVIGSRLYILTADEKLYEEFALVGKEFTYTVDMSEIPCGVNAALYTVEMGGEGQRDERRSLWRRLLRCPLALMATAGPEMDIQEASSKAMVFTAHCCQTSTSGCDTSGCGYNPYRDTKDKTFWAVGGKVDVSKPVTIVTQFVGTGASLTSIKRKYVQGGKAIDAAQDLNDKFCNWNGGGGRSMSRLGASFTKGHVIVFSLWDSDGMSWMDGGNAGPCTSYNVKSVESSRPNLKVTWSNVKFGDIDSTY
uniref:cellulose 1,4-beta-cellobiosidase (non-reducing end) n=1 Tax=uncultured symbiotic protist of Neotermes koshunensis TaxID=403660 RepID=A4UWX0_9EUKA|nr:putative glycosyl hydrolase family7 [uncultured symbiotic protist of Neotermes koshunensis]